MWEVTPTQQNGYYTTFFWANDGAFQSGNRYAGFHPYPFTEPRPDATVHHWEISANGSDTPVLAPWEGVDDNGNSTLVVKGVKYTQAASIKVVGSDYVITYYWSLPTLTKVVTWTFATSQYAGDPTSPIFVIGGNAWASTTENLSGDFGRIKIFSDALSGTDLASEGTDFTQLKTAAGTANIWFGIKNWASNTDLTCDYSTGRSLVWADSGNKATLVTP